MAVRRRLFGVLVLLFATAMAITASGLADWWVVLPPAGMLAGYMMLLHEAARADAERRSERARRHASVGTAGSGTGSAAGTRQGAEAGAATATAHSAVTAPATAHSDVTSTRSAASASVDERATARVIDLTAHVGDELYDQDAEAKLRAVGD